MSIGSGVLQKTVTAPAPRKGFGELFAEKKNELDHFQARMASAIMPSFPGQNVAKYGDLAVGIDAHATVFPPSPLLPVPHIGVVFDIMGAIMSAIASVVPPPPAEGDEGAPKVNKLQAICSAVVHAMKPSVQVHGRWVANAGTGIQHLPGIIAHVSFPVVAPMASSEMFMGSATVLMDGGPCSTQFHPALSCNIIGIPAIPRLNKPKMRMALMAPTSVLLFITSGGAPVKVGGPPTIDLFQLGLKVALKGLGMLFRRKPKVKGGGDAPPSKNPGAGKAQPSSKSCSKGEPIDMATGKVHSTNLDVQLPGPLPLSWERHYASNVEVETSLGYNWHHSYNMGMYNMRNGFATIRLSDGREAVVPLVRKGERFYNRREQLFFTHDESGYLMTDGDKLQYRFNGAVNAEGFRMLSSIQTSEGFSIQFFYHSNGRLREIVDSRGQRIEVTTNERGYIAGLYTLIDGVRNALIEYEYDSLGNLAYIKDIAGAEKFLTYKGHLLVQLQNQTGQSFYWEYEGSGDEAQCVHTWGDGGILEYWTEYKPGHTITRNSLGHTSEYFYDERLLIYKIIDENGGITYQTYNEYEELEIIVDPEGLTQKYYFNDYGKLVKLENENQQATSYQYDDRHNLVKVQTPGGNIVQWEYDELDRVICKAASGQQDIHYKYEDQHLSAIIDGLGNTYRLFFDRRHQLVQLSHPQGVHHFWDYDMMGRMVRSTDIRNNITSYKYDQAGNLTELTDPDGNRHIFAYDTSGNIIQARDRIHDVQFTYGSLGVLLSRTQNGRTVKFGYDTELQLKTISNEAGELYKFALDGMGNVVSEWGFDGMQRRYERDGIGRVVKTLRPSLKWSSYRYDGTGNVISEEHSDGNMTAYKYNADGLLAEAFNEVTHIRLQRGAGGRIMAEQQGDHNVQHQYNAAGQLVNISSSLGADIDIQYNELGRVQQMQSGDWQASWQYDKSGLELQRELSGGVRLQLERDKLGRVTRRSIGAHNIEQARHSYQWGKHNRLQSIVNELGRASVNFEYDAWDNLVSGTYNDRSGMETIYKAPDAVGNLFKTPERKDREYDKGGKLLQDDKYHYHYDAEGNLIFKEFKMSSSPAVIPRQEISENLGIALLGSGVGWQYEWAGNGMLGEVVLPQGGKVSFAYDPLGRRIAKQHKGKVTRWLWEGNVPLHEWSYEGEFPPVSSVQEDGSIKDQKEPLENVITWLFEDNSFVPCAKIVDGESYSIISDYLGTPTHAFDASGEKVWERELDIYGSLRKGDNEFVPFLYQGQYVDEETGDVYNRFRYYSAESGMYLSQDPIGLHGGIALYGYVHDTNTWIDPLGLQGNLYDIVEYGNKSPNLFNHHNIMDAWAKNNIPGYISRQSAQPTIQLTKELHEAAHAAERKWMKENFGKVRGNWDKMTARQMQELSEVMFDAAKVPKAARAEFYKKFNQYIYTKCH